MPSTLYRYIASKSSRTEPWLRRNEFQMEAPIRLDDDLKGFYLLVAALTSADKLQENWPRIIRHYVSESMKSAEGDLSLDPQGMTVVGKWNIYSDPGDSFQIEYVSEGSPEVTTESFTQRSQRLDRLGRIDSALDLIYDSIDEMMRNGQFSELDSLLSSLPIDSLSVDILLGYLTATLPARSRLLRRSEFFAKVELSIRTRSEYEAGLLTGLE